MTCHFADVGPHLLFSFVYSGDLAGSGSVRNANERRCFYNKRKGLKKHTVPISYLQAMWTPLDIPASPKQPFTDYSRWKLRDTDDGRHGMVAGSVHEAS